MRVLCRPTTTRHPSTVRSRPLLDVRYCIVLLSSFYLQHDMVQQETELWLTNRATHLCTRKGVVDFLKHAPPHICYYTEFGRSTLKDVGINTGEPPKLGRAGTALL